MSNRKRDSGGGHEGGDERWLLTYADMITLLLALFIVLFAMSSIDAKQFDNVKRSLSQTFNGDVLEEPGGVLPGSSGVLDPTAAADSPAKEVMQLTEATRRAEKDFDNETERLEKVIKQSNLGKDVKVVRTEQGIVISLAGDALFEPGEWALKEGITRKLTALEAELAQFNRPIEIAGHTDGTPYDGQWGNMGLSSDRANSVYKLFADLGYDPARMKPTFFGDTRPAVPPTSPGAAMRENRRIEITILEPGAESGLPDVPAVAKVAAPKPKPVESHAAKPAAAHTAPHGSAEVDAAVAGEFDLVGDLADTSKGIG